MPKLPGMDSHCSYTKVNEDLHKMPITIGGFPFEVYLKEDGRPNGKRQLIPIETVLTDEGLIAYKETQDFACNAKGKCPYFEANIRLPGKYDESMTEWEKVLNKAKIIIALEQLETL
jgi:hypothetical protein